jgi:hypothetical protein
MQGTGNREQGTVSLWAAWRSRGSVTRGGSSFASMLGGSDGWGAGVDCGSGQWLVKVVGDDSASVIAELRGSLHSAALRSR